MIKIQLIGISTGLPCAFVDAEKIGRGLALHKAVNDDGYSVSDLETGARIASGQTREQAKRNAKG